MNILPKKRWHVRTKQNIERVRRDEAAAAEAEKELKRRIQLAEQEARTEFLRKKSKQNAADESPTVSKDNQSSEKHINFFSDIEEAGQYLGGTSKEYEIEKREEKEKFEKNIGLLTYLGQNSAEATGSTPWYLESHSKRLKLEEDESSEQEIDKSKEFLDPLNIMKKYMKKKEKSSTDERSKYSSKTQELKKHKYKEGEKPKDSKSLESLRAERLKREKEERERANRVLEKLHNKESSQQQKEIIVDERLRRYNSQFNPHLARQTHQYPDPL